MSDKQQKSRFPKFGLFKTKGRLNRIDHFLLIFALFAVTLIYACSYLFLYKNFQGLFAGGGISSVLFAITHLAFFAVMVVQFFCLKIRRLHDCNLSAWWALLLFLGPIGFFWGVALFFIPGSKEGNRFGLPS